MKRFFAPALLFTLALLMLGRSEAPAEQNRITCSSTTSTQNSGLFDYILPHFQRRTGIKVDVIAVGTGQALAIAKKGDADVVFVHDPEAEAKFVAEGYGIDRRKVMYNDFVVLGTQDDPAHIRGLKDAARSFKQIAETKTAFVSRGDESGTNKAEWRIWKTSGISPKGQKWYMETGQGMESTLRIADEKRGYTLSDRGTWLALKSKQPLGLEVCVEGDPLLFNQYSAMAVNPVKHHHVKYKEALAFINWLVSPEGQKLIGNYRDRNGQQLFVPNAGK